MSRPGERLIELFHQLGVSVPTTPLSDGEFQSIKTYLTTTSGGNCLDESLLAFLQDLLRSDAYDGRIIHVVSGRSFVDTQTNGALTELPDDAGFVQFAYWDGDSGGDAWIYDLPYNCIRCISPMMMGPYPMTEVRARSYGVFFDCDGFVSYLRGVAEARGWMKLGAAK